MLTEEQTKFLKGEKTLTSEQNRCNYRRRIREKAKKALEDLSLISDNVSNKEFEEIFTEERAGNLIQKLLLPGQKFSNYEEKADSLKPRADLIDITIEVILKCDKLKKEIVSDLLKPTHNFPDKIAESREEIEKAEDYYGRTKGDLEDSTFGEVLEIYDKEVKTEERILRTCYKWRSKGEIAEATDLSREIVDEKVDKLSEEGKLKKQNNGWRYKSTVESE